jgi:hypothetical protein
MPTGLESKHRAVILYDKVGNTITTITDGNVRAVVVAGIDDAKNKQNISASGEALVGSGATLTLTSTTVPTGKKFKLQQVIIGGDGAGEFRIKNGAVTLVVVRNSGSYRTIPLELIPPEIFNSGGIASITVKNNETKPRNFEARIGGYLYDG